MNFTELDGYGFFRFFKEMSLIPHGSHNTDAMRDYLVKFAGDRGLILWADDAGNVAISKPASPGYETEPGIIIQGHMDMVAVKKPGSSKDMTKDPLELAVDGDWLYAKDTSLGADDGIAVAYALAVMDDDSIPHPPLEAVFTTDEEVGMLSAAKLDIERLSGSRMINIDFPKEGVFVSGCTGAARVETVIGAPRSVKAGKAYAVKLSGLQGGHAGAVIKEGRANALKLMGRVMKCLRDSGITEVFYLAGGDADNAVPRECVLKFVAAEDAACAFRESVKRLETDLKKEYSGRDDGLYIEVSIEEGGTQVCKDCINEDAFVNIEKLLRTVPDGLQTMSGEIEGLPQLSLNNGIAALRDDGFSLTCSIRGAVDSEWEELTDQVVIIGELCGGKTRVYGKHPGWEFRKGSPFRDKCAEVFREMYGKDPEITAAHGGLEPGMFISKRPDMDCISVGPDTPDVHTTEERLSISSAVRIWEFLLKVLERKD